MMKTGDNVDHILQIIQSKYTAFATN